MTPQPTPPLRTAAMFGIAFAAVTVLLSLLGTADAMTGVALTAGAGATAAIGRRAIAALAAIVLILASLVHGVADLRPAEWVGAVVLVMAALVRRLPLPPFAPWGWAMTLTVTVALGVTARWSAPGSVGWTMLLLGAAIGGALGGFAAARRITGGGALAVAARYSLGDSQRLSQTTRHLLLGRIAGGMSHELSQALNVITMANGNLGYVLDRANVPDPQGAQMAERVRKIAVHADAAAQILGQFRWFGQDGGRDGGEMTVGSALERAVSATRAPARKSGVVVEIRGDALVHPVPLRHGTIEMMATAALLEVMQMLASRPADSGPPQPIVLEATRTETDIEISVLSRSGEGCALPADGVADASFDLVARLAANCRSELRRLGQKSYPVRFILRLDRDVV